MIDGTGEEAQENGKDRFNLENLVVPQNYEAMAGLTKVHLAISVRKPDPLWWTRVHPDPAYCARLFLLEDRDERETYLVAPHLVEELEREVRETYVFTAVNRKGTPFLWPAKAPADKGRGNAWNETGLMAARMAMKQWVRVVANQGAGAYEVLTTAMTLPEPTWPPNKSFRDLLELGFGKHLIDDPNHELLRQLRGEV